MVQVAPRLEVGRGSFTPARFGLFSAAEMPGDEGADVHWRNGVQFEVDECSVPLGMSIGPCPVPDATPKTVMQGQDWAAAASFTLYAGRRCSPAGEAAREALDKVDRRLTANEQKAVEFALWTGQAEVRPAFSVTGGPTFDSSGVLLQPGLTQPVTGGTAQSIVEGFATLEGALADCYSGQGTLHMTREMATAAYSNRLIDRYGDRLETGVGTSVVAGTGYPGSGPNNSLPPVGQQWVFATGPVRVRRSPIWHPGEEEGEILARATNDRVAIAERTYAVSVECCLIAVLIDIAP